MKEMLEKWFSLRERGTDFWTEVVGGVVTFLTMAYIIAVNPSILSAAGMPQGALVTATCLAAGLTTILMGLYADLPFALASGMGLNAFFAYTVCIGMKVSWRTALAAVFVEGVIFIVLTLTRVREKVVEAIPHSLKIAVSGAIGMFIAFIGLMHAAIVVKDPNTFVTMGTFSDPRALIFVLGFAVIAWMLATGRKGAMLAGIAASTCAAWVYAWYVGPQQAASLDITLPKAAFGVESIAPIAFSISFEGVSFWAFVSILVTFLFVDFFDTVGTVVGVAAKAGLLDEHGDFPRARDALLVDAVGTTGGALLGVSTVTTYVESAAGVAEGARTGLSAVVCGLLFLLSAFLAPVFVAVPGCATAPALVMVGFFMMQNVTSIDFQDVGEGVPAFLTILAMPLTFSIADGLMFGVLSYTMINAFTERGRTRISTALWLLAAVFLLRLATT